MMGLKSMNELDSKLAKLEKFAEDRYISNLHEHIYALDLKEEFIKGLPKEKLVYVHVKLHSLLSYRRFSSQFDVLKKLHNKVAAFLDFHPEVDRLDG